MHYVYILASEKDPSKTYVGYTARSPKDRLTEHNNGISPHTHSYRPWKLIYYECFHCQKCAEEREKFLKSGFGYRLKKLLIENYQKLR